MRTLKKTPNPRTQQKVNATAFDSVMQDREELKDALSNLLNKLEEMNGAMAVNIQDGHEEVYPEITEARDTLIRVCRP